MVATFVVSIAKLDKLNHPPCCIPETNCVSTMLQLKKKVQFTELQGRSHRIKKQSEGVSSTGKTVMHNFPLKHIFPPYVIKLKHFSSMSKGGFHACGLCDCYDPSFLHLVSRQCFLVLRPEGSCLPGGPVATAHKVWWGGRRTAGNWRPA